MQIHGPCLLEEKRRVSVNLERAETKLFIGQVRELAHFTSINNTILQVLHYTEEHKKLVAMFRNGARVMIYLSDNKLSSALYRQNGARSETLILFDFYKRNNGRTVIDVSLS